MTLTSDAPTPSRPLAGLRILDISTVVAGPFASTLLADLGAEVLKVEMPGAGDALRRLAAAKDGVAVWWEGNKRDKWGITGEWLQGINPRLIILRITGFGQTGPYRNNPGFARVFEAMSGLTRMCGEEGGTPLHLGYPLSA